MHGEDFVPQLYSNNKWDYYCCCNCEVAGIGIMVTEIKEWKGL